MRFDRQGKTFSSMDGIASADKLYSNVNTMNANLAVVTHWDSDTIVPVFRSKISNFYNDSYYG